MSEPTQKSPRDDRNFLAWYGARHSVDSTREDDEAMLWAWGAFCAGRVCAELDEPPKKRTKGRRSTGTDLSKVIHALLLMGKVQFLEEENARLQECAQSIDTKEFRPIEEAPVGGTVFLGKFGHHYRVVWLDVEGVCWLPDLYGTDVTRLRGQKIPRPDSWCALPSV